MNLWGEKGPAFFFGNKCCNHYSGDTQPNSKANKVFVWRIKEIKNNNYYNRKRKGNMLLANGFNNSGKIWK